MQGFYLISTSFLPHSYFHTIISLFFPLNLTVTLLSTCNSMSFCSWKILAMCHVMAKLQSHNLSSLSSSSSPRRCPFKLLEHPFWRCHCQCHSNFLPTLFTPNLILPGCPPLSGVALSTRQLNAKCRIVNTSFHFLPVLLFSLLYPTINSRWLQEGYIRRKVQEVLNSFY